MGFYSEWLNSINTQNAGKYIRSFLSSTPQSLLPLLSGNIDELVCVCKVLLNTPIERFIEEINCDNYFSAENIIQFSNFEHAITSVITLLETEDKDLTFTELGWLIMHSKLEGACKKYGENHSKLAAELSLVTLEKNKSYYVKITSLGKFLNSLDNKEKYEIIKRLSLRNCFIKELIYRAKKQVVLYSDLAMTVLSESTMIRRKSNVKYLVSLILENNELLNNIVW